MRNKYKSNFITYPTIFAIVIATILGMFYLLWITWCFIFGYFWPTGPQQIINPDFIPFSIAWFFFTLVLRVIKTNLLEKG